MRGNVLIPFDFDLIDTIVPRHRRHPAPGTLDVIHGVDSMQDSGRVGSADVDDFVDW